MPLEERPPKDKMEDPSDEPSDDEAPKEEKPDGDGGEKKEGQNGNGHSKEKNLSKDFKDRWDRLEREETERPTEGPKPVGLGLFKQKMGERKGQRSDSGFLTPGLAQAARTAEANGKKAVNGDGPRPPAEEIPARTEKVPEKPPAVPTHKHTPLEVKIEKEAVKLEKEGDTLDKILSDLKGHRVGFIQRRKEELKKQAQMPKIEHEPHLSKLRIIKEEMEKKRNAEASPNIFGVGFTSSEKEARFVGIPREERMKAALKVSMDKTVRKGSIIKRLDEVLDQPMNVIQEESDEAKQRLLDEVSLLDTRGFEGRVKKLLSKINMGKVFQAERDLLNLKIAMEAQRSRETLKHEREERLESHLQTMGGPSADLEDVVSRHVKALEIEIDQTRARVNRDLRKLDTIGFEHVVRKINDMLDEGRSFDAEEQLLELRLALKARELREELKAVRGERISSKAKKAMPSIGAQAIPTIEEPALPTDEQEFDRVQKDLLEEIEEADEEPQQLNEVQCGVCGTILKVGATVCPACGTSFVMAAERTSTEPDATLIAELESVEEDGPEEGPEPGEAPPKPMPVQPGPPRPPEPPELSEIQCGVCGSIVPSGAKRCRACGTLLAGIEAAGDAEEQAPALGEPEEYPALAPIEEEEGYPVLVPIAEEEPHPGFVPIDESEGYPQLVPIEEEESFPMLAPTDDTEPYPEIVPGKGIRCPSCQDYSPVDSINCIKCGTSLSLPILEPVEPEEGAQELVPISDDMEVTEELAPGEGEPVEELAELTEVFGEPELEAEGIEEQELVPVEEAEAVPWTEPPAEVEKELEWRRLCVRAKRFYNDGRVKASLEAYDDAIEIKPSFCAYYGKGEALLSLGWTNSALDCFNQALEIDEEEVSGWVQKAKALETLGRYNDALESVDRALAIDDKYQDAWQLKGSLLLLMGRTEDAIQALDRYVGIKPTPESLRQVVEITKMAMAKAAAGVTAIGVEPVEGEGVEAAGIKGVTAEEELAAVEEEEIGALQTGAYARRYRTLAKQRGLTNGFALVNGRGLTNGKSLINGRFSLINGRSKVNGIRGVTNGLGKGLINGRGLVNGASGLVNGRAMRDTHEATPVIRFKRGQRSKALLVAGTIAVIALLIIIPFANTFLFQKPSGIVVDGQFQDWSGVTFHDDSMLDQQSNLDVNIVQYAMALDSKSISFLVKVPGGSRILGGANEGVDVVHIFLDTDGSEWTGYSIEGIGADAMLEIYGWSGKVESASMFKFNTSGQRDPEDWNGWIPGPAISAISKNNQLEIKVARGDIGAFQSQNLLALLHLSDMSGDQDFSDTIISKAKGTLTVNYDNINAPLVQPGTATMPFIRLNITARTTIMEVQTISITKVGHMFNQDGLGDVRLWADRDGNGQFSATSDVQLTNGTFGAQGTGSDRVLLQPLNPIEVQPDSMTTLFVTVDLLNTLPMHQTLGLDIDRSDIKVKQGAVTLTKIRPSLSYIGSPTSVITIDGEFGDWAQITAYTDLSADTGPNLIPRVDIRDYRSHFDTQSVSFYLSTTSDIMTGMIVPDLDKTRPPATPPNQTNVTPGPPVTLPRMTGADLAIIYLDSDQDPATGLGFAGVSFGADFMIQLEGKAGFIISTKLYEYTGSGSANPWSEVNVAVPAANDRFRLETQVSRSALGLDQYQRVDAFFVMSDWELNSDVSDSVLSGNRGLLQAKTVDVLADSIIYGTADVPLFGLDMQASEDIIIKDLTFTRFGNSTDIDTGGVYIYQDNGDHIFNALDTGTSLGDGQFIQGTARVTLDQPIVVQAGVGTLLYLAADFTLMGRFHTIGVTIERTGVSSSAQEVRGAFPMSTFLSTIASESDRSNTYSINYTDGVMDGNWNRINRNSEAYVDDSYAIERRNFPAGSDVRYVKICDDGTWLNFNVVLEGNIASYIHVYIDTDLDRIAEYDLIYDRVNGVVILYVANGANWNLVNIVAKDRFDRVNAQLEMGIEFNYLGLVGGQRIRYQVRTETNTIPGGGFTDCAPGRLQGTGWSARYRVIPEFKDLIIPIVGTIIILGLIRQRQGRTKHGVKQSKDCKMTKSPVRGAKVRRKIS